SFLSEMLRAPEHEFVLEHMRSGRPLARRVELAIDSRSRRRGLLGRDAFEPGSARIIAPCGAIHTFFMRFSIDVVFVGRDGRVRKTCEAVPPRRIALSLGAFAAIELPAGTIGEAEVTRGDRVRLAHA